MDAREDQPLGYLLHRVAYALRTEVTATVLDPLGAVLPAIPLHAGAVEIPRPVQCRTRPRHVRLPAGDEHRVRSLRTAGWSPARPSVASGRSLPAELTREGRDTLSRTDSGVRAAEQRLMANLSDAQRRDFKRILVALGAD